MEELDELGNRLIHAQGMAVLREQGHSEEAAKELMDRFWTLGGVEMKNGVPMEQPKEPGDE